MARMGKGPIKDNGPWNEYGNLVDCMVTIINKNVYLEIAKELHPKCAYHKRKGSMERNKYVNKLKEVWK